MPRTRSNGIEIEYETFGNEEAAPLLLVGGLGAQMIVWDEEFCERLAERGHRVIRFDNRDVGLSTWLSEAGVPNVMMQIQQFATGEPVAAPYTLSDMANDAVGLLDALEIEAAHVVGASMGGMIAQSLAIEHPDRVRSLTSIMSTTGDPTLPPAKPEAIGALMAPPPNSREAAIEQSVATSRAIGNTGFPFDESAVRTHAGRSYDRAFHPDGTARQMAAIMASGNRAEALRCLDISTLVIHGDADPLIRPEGGRHTAECIPDAELLTIEGMGHDLPRGAWAIIFDAIETLTHPR
jgi:pimeloyl-ACP methyl ester carboxylesterase